MFNKIELKLCIAPFRHAAHESGRQVFNTWWLRLATTGVGTLAPAKALPPWCSTPKVGLTKSKALTQRVLRRSFNPKRPAWLELAGYAIMVSSIFSGNEVQVLERRVNSHWTHHPIHCLNHLTTANLCSSHSQEPTIYWLVANFSLEQGRLAKCANLVLDGRQ